MLSQRKSLMPALMVGALGLELIILLATLSNTLNLYRREAAPPTLVQTQDGNAFIAAPAPSKTRTDETIRAFTARTLAMLFSWSPEMPGPEGEPIPDPGYSLTRLGTRNKLPTPAYLATYSVSPDFRLEFQQELADSMPQGVFEGDTTTLLEISHLSDPERLEAGRWELEVVGVITLLSATGEPLSRLPYDKRITVRALNVPLPPPQNPVQALIHSVRQSGLEIEKIEPLLDPSYR